MNAKEVNSTFDLVAHIGAIVNLKKSGAYWISQNGCPLCRAGDDHFQIRRFSDGDQWMSRKCYADTKYHSAIDFLMAYHKETFLEALKRAGGEAGTTREPTKGKPVTPPAPVQVIPDQTWQAKAWKLIDEANSQLISNEAGEPGRRYLLARGVHRGSIFMHLLGFSVIGKRPAIVIPWLDVGNVVTAIKYRFIDELANRDTGKRFSMMAGSMPYLFGLQHVLEADTTLLFVEGELNAISVLQTLPRGVSVVSAGSEGNGNAALLKALARHYARIVIWTDRPENARTIRERMNRPDARLLKSPTIDGVKYDANQMLQAGLLMEFITAELATVCQGLPVDTTVSDYMRTSVTA